MRISTSQIFNTGSRNILESQAALYRVQNQLSTGRKILTPSDDPVGASQILLDTQAREVNLQHADNQSNANLQLALVEDRIKQVAESILYIKEKIVAANNSSLSDSQREFFANDLQQQFDHLVGMANSANASGHYLFSGFQGETQPFQLVNGQVQYFGDQGQRMLQVGAGRQIAVSDSGYDIFMRNRTGNGTFATSNNSANTGTGTISNGSVLSPAAWVSGSYSIDFTSANTYTVTDPSSAVSGPFNYVAGDAITNIPGISFVISGAPAAGDSFAIDPSTNQSVFDSVQNLIDTFKTPVAGNPAAFANMQNVILQNSANMERALENVSRVQATIGARRNELASLTEVSKDLDIHFQEKISNIQDIDYAETISRFMSQQLQLEAAQSSFSKMSGLSLFNYI